MRWVPVSLMVLFSDVVNNLYALVTVGFIIRNVLISLYAILPSGETRNQIHQAYLEINIKDSILFDALAY